MSCAKWVVCVLLLAGSLPSLAAAPSVILITLDTTRADRMGFLGSMRGLTPNLDVLARQSVVFAHAYAQVPLTTPSHAVILTGTYPEFNQVSDLGTPLRAEVPYLPDELRKHHYATAAFVGSQVLDPKGVGAPGFERGFDTYDAGFHSRRSGEDRYHSVERRAMIVVDHALAWLDHQDRMPFFLWVHLYDPHDPYDPPAPFKARYADTPYDGEIAYADSALGKLLAGLRKRSVYDEAVIAFAADHGEAFGEHGERSHGFFLYDETIHVPLLVKLPKGQSAGVRVERRVSLVDVAPTLLNAAGVAAPAAMQGEPLLGAMKSERKAREPAVGVAYAETDYPYRAFGWSPLHALRTGKYLYVQAPERELYDQSTDPRAVHNLVAGAKAVADTLAAQLAEFQHKTGGGAEAAPPLRPEQVEQLQALGYIVGAAKANVSGKEGRADSKDKIEIANLMHEALLAAEEERYDDVVWRLERVVREEPQSALANLELGRALNRLGNFQKAVPWLRNSVDLSPESGKAHFELGMSLAETGDLVGAAQQFETAGGLAPNSEDVHFALGSVYDQMRQATNAMAEFRATLQLNPDHFGANLMLGRLLAMQDREKEALSYLRNAARLEPHSVDAHKFLANVYVQLGQEENARREQEEAKRLEMQARQ